MKQTILYLSFLFLVVFFISCENNVEETMEDLVVSECNSAISFSEQIKPIIDTNCLQCHNGNQFPDLRTYQSIKNFAAIIKEETQTRRMPLGGSLTTDEIKAIACWIDSGSLNN
ncbi:hypothetical protein Lupro_11665 [Lutibacter profundi]|uniref:Cytochrome c domain-containing protein n=1 Tax=Lutibacter profundi TaxID=1622118 RepID=A0A0X8G879_9FLAO|nr:hypothetical protein [Lutibacter profundi]AMC11882.1 hypothetical protein Lupro_11665 [Lutibacter profundi]